MPLNKTNWFYMQNVEAIALVLSCVGTVCWAVCFWWMHRISSRQDMMLEELHEMTARIEKLSQSEHDLISDVHPQVNEIKEHVQDVREAVSPEKS
jgi:divalent metal cation (Fe/Co/Zn/Cd) transporter